MGIGRRLFMEGSFADLMVAVVVVALGLALLSVAAYRSGVDSRDPIGDDRHR